MDDEPIIKRVLAGESEAYSLLVEKYKRLVFSIAYQVAGQREDAEDLAQEVFVKAFLKLKYHKTESNFANWLYRITLNSAISKRRKKMLRVVTINDRVTQLAENKKVGLQQGKENAEREEIVSREVDKLPEEERLLVSLKYYNGCSINDIAGITGLSESNVKIKLYRIRKHLFEMLDPVLNKNHVL